jgi:hypothetical protein
MHELLDIYIYQTRAILSRRRPATVSLYMGTDSCLLITILQRVAETEESETLMRRFGFEPQYGKYFQSHV